MGIVLLSVRKYVLKTTQTNHFLMRYRNAIIIAVVFLASFFLFARDLHVHGLEYRDDEIFYVRSTQEMLADANFISPTYFGEDRFQKPILFYWLIILSYAVFGVGWVSARLVSVFFGALTVCLAWQFARKIATQRIAAVSVLILMTIPLFFRHARGAVPDMTFTFFIVLAMYYAFAIVQRDAQASPKYQYGFFVACAVGFMVKGFIAVILPVSTLILTALFLRRMHLVRAVQWARGTVIFFAITAPWFLTMIVLHGPVYMQYMLQQETKNRVLGGDSWTILSSVRFFLLRLGMYLHVILSYFAPWSIFIAGAVPFAVADAKKEKDVGSIFLLVWIFFTIILFSSMHFAINHYMLPIAVPCAIVTGMFFSRVFDDRRSLWKAFGVMRPGIVAVIFVVGVCAFAFIAVFLAGGSVWLLCVYGALIIGGVYVMCTARDPLIAPMVLGLFIFFGYSQSSLLATARMIAHPVLSDFARTAYADAAGRSFIVGVGSSAIHEKELQVYVDQPVKIAMLQWDPAVRYQLSDLFSEQEVVYCILTSADFQAYQGLHQGAPITVIGADYVTRRHLAIDRYFWGALFKFDKEKVRAYFMEKVLLVRKDERASL